MKNKRPTLTLWCAILAVGVGFAGCSGKTDANSELEKAAKALGPADQPTPAPAQQTQPIAAPATAQQSPRQQMDQAMTLYKSGDYENAMTRLQTLRERSTTLSPQQTMAVQDAMAAVMTDVYSRASKGDARAQQAVKQYEQSKTQRAK
jgi:hypothetical protein